MKELFLIRHGEAGHMVSEMSGGWSNSKLTKLGESQATKTGQKLKSILKSKNFQFYSSDLTRASETAEILGKILESRVILNPDLRELNTGLAINKTKEEATLLEQPMTEPIWDWVPYPEGESWRMLKNRIYSFMSKIDNNELDTVLIVTHGGPLVLLVFWWLKLPEEANISFEFDPCSITELKISQWGERTIAKLNDTAHLLNISEYFSHSS